MIAKEEGVDYTEIKAYQEEKKQEALEIAQAGQTSINQNFGSSQGGESKPKEEDSSAMFDKLMEKQGANDTTMKSIMDQPDDKIINALESKKVMLKSILKNMQFERGRLL